MPLETSFRNLKPRDEVKNRAEVLYAKLERFLDPDAEGSLTVTVEHGNAIMELVIVTRGDTQKAVEEHEELRTALDKVYHTMEMQLRRRKERRIDRRRENGVSEDGFEGDASDDDDDFQDAAPPA